MGAEGHHGADQQHAQRRGDAEHEPSHVRSPCGRTDDSAAPMELYHGPPAVGWVSAKRVTHRHRKGGGYAPLRSLAPPARPPGRRAPPPEGPPPPAGGGGPALHVAAASPLLAAGAAGAGLAARA